MEITPPDCRHSLPRSARPRGGETDVRQIEAQALHFDWSAATNDVLIGCFSRPRGTRMGGT